MDHIARKIEKRNRPPVSCEACRTRKLKCNRGEPCESCVKRGKAASCRYAAHASRSNSIPRSTKLHDLGDRLERLEKLFSSFSTREISQLDGPAHPFLSGNTTASRPGKAVAPVDPLIQGSDDGRVDHIDPGHWRSVLEDIREVREHLLPSSTPPSHHQPYQHDAGVLCDTRSRVGVDDVLSSLPQQPVCDMLLSWYFNSRYMVLGIVHPAKFRNEYQSFWESPSTSTPLWIALLFSILSIATTLRQMAKLSSIQDASVPSPTTLQEATMQCLRLGRYATANAYALEAFLLHLQSCFLSNGLPVVDLWFEMGTIIRLAFRSGHHRDPSGLVGVSPFDGEMRRRLWLNIVQIDALLSFQLGLPSMIASESADTEVPRNLEYCDLQVDMVQLPTARPLSEHTPVLYTIVKSGVMAVFKKIASHAQLLMTPPYETTLELEAEMRRAYSQVPETYQCRDVKRCFMDPSSLILERCTIEMLYLKGIVILLRRFVSYDSKDSAYESGRRACIEAALGMLARQADVSKACEPGGRLYEDRWMFSALSAHDFLLASMVVCLDLSVHLSTGAQGREDLADRELRALQTACQIWHGDSPSSQGMRVATEAIKLMVRKVGEKNNGSLSGLSPPLAAAAASDDVELPYAGAMSQMIDGPETTDWFLLDQYFQGLDGWDWTA